jgi:hypothetical protein
MSHDNHHDRDLRGGVEVGVRGEGGGREVVETKDTNIESEARVKK